MSKPSRSAAPDSEWRFKITLDFLSTVISSWLIPGAGHFLLGYRVRGTIIGASILILFWVGQSLAVSTDAPRWTPMAVSREVSPVFFACQVGNGMSTLVSNQLWGKPHNDNASRDLDWALPRHINLAILLTSVSGLLNLLVVLHILDPRTWKEAREAARQTSPAPAGGA